MKNKLLLILATIVVLSLVYVLNNHQTKSQRNISFRPIPLQRAGNQSKVFIHKSPQRKLLEKIKNKTLLPFQRTQSRYNKKSSKTIMVKTLIGGASGFTIADSFAFPHALNSLKDVKKIASTRWVQDLASIMTTWPDNRTVMVVSGNTDFQQPLLNWMISAVLKANISLDRILILAVDEKLYKLLKERSIESIFVPPSSLYDSKSIKLSTHQLITYSRFAVVRLLNHWGFTVAHYDSDALILRDTQQIFKKYPSSSIVASRGAGPKTLCAGAILFRSSRQMEEYWIEASKWKGDNDQKMLNEVLSFLTVKWHYHQQSDAVDGECLRNGMNISIMPSKVMCRRKCSTNLVNKVYVWHPRTAGQGNGLDIIKTMSKEGLAYVSHDWSKRCNSKNIIGEDWLKCVSSLSFNSSATN